MTLIRRSLKYAKRQIILSREEFRKEINHRTLWSGYKLVCEAAWRARHLRSVVDGGYLRTGYKVGTLPSELLECLQNFLSDRPELSPGKYFYIRSYWNSPLYFKSTDKAPTRFLDLNDDRHEVFEKLLQYLKKPVTECLGSSWRVLNIRYWATPATAEAVGPNDWHSDGLADGVRKIMIYLTPAGREHGTTEIIGRDGYRTIVRGSAGTWVLFEVSELMHRGIAPKTGTRLVLEVTIGPALRHSSEITYAGTFSTYPFIPWHKPKTIDPAEQVLLTQS